MDISSASHVVVTGAAGGIGRSLARAFHAAGARVTITDLAQLVTTLAGAGADLFPDTNLEDFLREKGGLPPKSASDDL